MSTLERLRWFIGVCSFASFCLMVWLVRADEVRWIYQQQESGKPDLVVLHLDQAPPDIRIELWHEASVRKLSLDDLKAMVAAPAK